MRQLLAVAFLSLTLAASEAAATKVAVFSVDGDRDTEDLCIAAISQHPEIQLVDRRSLNQILGEQVVTAAFASTAKAAQLGKLSGIDLLLSIRREMKGAHNLNLEVLDCATGRILSHGSATGESLPRETQRLIKQAESSSSPHAKAIKVAVEDFSEGGKAINYKLAAAIRGALTDEGFDVLDRAVIQHAAAEHEVEKAGLSTGNLTSLPGVDYLLTGTVENQTLNLKLLDASKGRLVTGSSFPMATAINDTVHLLKAQAKGMKPNPVSILEPRVQIEALVPLYEGIKHFRDGDIYGALLSFWKAQSLDDKFMEAYEWEARCFDALKLPRLGEAIRRFARECLVGLGVSVPSINIPSDGITFLGIQSETSTPLLEMKAVEKLVKAAPGQIVLPDELSIFRNEYDAVIGGSDKAWLTAPGFLTRWSLRASPSQADRSKLEWTLFDTLSGGIVGTATTEADNPEAWEIPLRKLLMEKDSPTPQKADAAPALTTNSPAKMNLSQSSLNPDDKENLGILEMLLNNPTNPALRNKLFKREGDNGQLGFLNFALRDQVIESLPPDDSYRAWLELDRIASFLPNDLSGIQFSGKEIDPISALKDFVEGHPHDGSGAFAQYMLLYNTMADMDPKERIKRCHETVELLRQANDARAFEGSNEMLGMAQHLEVLAHLASDETQNITELPGKPFPRRARPDLGKDGGHVGVNWTSDWYCGEWQYVPIPQEKWSSEARLAFKILGRGSNQVRIPSSWIKEYPDSILLLDFAVMALHEVDYARGLPLKEPVDMKEARQTYRMLVDYCARQLPERLARAGSSHELNFLAKMAGDYVKRLTRYAFSATVSDQDFQDIQKTMTRAVTDAARRIGEDPSRLTAFWSTMPRYVSSDIWNNWNECRADVTPTWDELLQQESEKAVRSFADSPTEQRDWWNFMNEGPVRSLRTQKQAEMALSHLGRMEEIFPLGDELTLKMLGVREAAFIYNYATILFMGRHYQEAEPWFRLVASRPESELTLTRTSREIRENARLHLAYCLEKSGQLNEALLLARECAEKAAIEKAPMRALWHIWPDGAQLKYDADGFVYGHALRLIRDIRLISSISDLPPNVKAFQIPIEGGHGAKVTYFLRIPPSRSDSSKMKKHPLLVLVPSSNHGGAAYMLDSNSWARFADKYGIFLLVPEFTYLAEEAANTYENPQDWSGKTLVDAVDWVAKNYPVHSKRFLMHGYGRGAQFVERFIRLEPDRCLAVSVHSTGADSWRDGIPKLKPLTELRSVPLFMTCGDRDDARSGLDRLIGTELYAGAAAASGVNVELKILPNTGHQPTKEMEEMAQDFFIRQTHLTSTIP